MSTALSQWENHAACAETMTELWYGPEDYDEPWEQTLWRRRRAAEICDTCPVWRECLADELTRTAADQHGIRAGMTVNNRIALLSRWRCHGLIPANRPPDINTAHALLDSAGGPARRVIGLLLTVG